MIRRSPAVEDCPQDLGVANGRYGVPGARFQSPTVILTNRSEPHAGPSFILPQVSKVKQTAFKPISANVDVDLDSFKQPLLRYLAHYFLQIPMWVVV